MEVKVWINGCFDVLHIGHINLIEFGKTLGTKVRVGIDSDERVKMLKGVNKPFNNQEDRKKMLSAIKNVDDVVIFENETELELKIKEYSPDVLLVGDDYRNKPVVGEKYAKGVCFYKKIDGYSTTRILKNESK